MSNSKLNEILENTKRNENNGSLFPRTVDRFGTNRENFACTNHSCSSGQRPTEIEEEHVIEGYKPR